MSDPEPYSQSPSSQTRKWHTEENHAHASYPVDTNRQNHILQEKCMFTYLLHLYLFKCQMQICRLKKGIENVYSMLTLAGLPTAGFSSLVAGNILAGMVLAGISFSMRTDFSAEEQKPEREQMSLGCCNGISKSTV